MTIRVFSLDFDAEGGMAMPRDRKLHKLAVEFADAKLAEKINFTDYKKVWVAAEVDENDVPVRVEGLLAMVYRIDFPVVRFTSARSAKSLIDRANDYIHDQGARGAEVFVYISDHEKDEQRCPQWGDWLKAVGAKPAERVLVKVK